MLTPEGIYSGICVDIGPNTSSKGTPEIEIVFDLQYFWNGTEWIPTNEGKAYFHFYFAPGQSTDISLRELSRVDYKGPMSDPSITKDPVQFLECFHDEYPKHSGKYNAKWRFQQDGTSRERTAPPQDVMDRIDALQRNYAETKAVPSTTPPAAPPPVDDNDGHAPSDEDIPQ